MSKSLGDICSRFSSGKSISADRIHETGIYPVFGGNGVRGYTDEYNFSGECAIIGRQGAYCGNVRYYEGKAYMTEHAIVACANDEYNPRYLAYKLSTMKLESYQGQSAQPGLSVNTLSKIVLEMPSKVYQDKVSILLGAMDEKVENNQNAVCMLEILAKTIYDYWFLQYDFPDENGKPYKSSGGEMVWNEELKREIPVGWKVSSIGKLFTTNRGVSYNSETLEGEGVPMINLASFTPTGEYKAEGIKNYSGEYTDDKVLKPYDLVMCNTQQTAIDFSKDIIGRALLVPDIFEEDIVSSHHVNTIRTEDEDLKFYLYYLFNTDHFHKYATGYANGTNILGLVFEGVEKYVSEIPEKRVLHEFAELALSIEKKKSEIIRENQELVSLRDFLLPLLMNGQVGFREKTVLY